MAECLTQIQLATDEVNIVINSVQQNLPCEIVIETAPRPLLLIQITGLDPWMALRPQRTFELQLVRAGITCNAFIASSADGVISFTPQTEPFTVGASQSLACVSFDVINFPHFWAMDTPTTKLPDDHLDIIAGDWELYIRPQRQTDRRRCSAQRSTPSHTPARFGRKLSSPPTMRKHFSLGFMMCSLLLPVNGSGKCLYVGSIRTRDRSGNSGGPGACTRTLGRSTRGLTCIMVKLLPNSFPGCWLSTRIETRAKNMHSAIYWYIRASGIAPGVDGGIILLQAALELLAWQYFILDSPAQAPKQFLKTPASDRMRLLLQACGIPINIPTELTDLASVAAQRHWQDGPKALAGVRNQLVHPGTHQGMPYYDAWRLAEWYVELVLLHMLSFQGEYSNRIKHRWVGEVERVPWA